MNSSQQFTLLATIITTAFIAQGCTPQKTSVAVEEKVEIRTSDKEQEIINATLPRNIPAHVMDQAGLTTLSEQVTPAQAKNRLHKRAYEYSSVTVASPSLSYPTPPPYPQESYNPVREQSFINASNDSLSTFSIDVDTGSYTNIRRFLSRSQKVPVGAVRIEEMLNYFQYDYPSPGTDPVAISTEIGPCPWNSEHKIAMIGLKAKEIDAKELPPSNLVFLIDVSGSMNQPQKLPLVKSAMKMLTEQLSKDDRISIVVYAGSNRVVLPPTGGDKKEKIVKAINQLHSGGSTHGSAAIVKAYELANQNYFSGGNNRIILASDGDFNVGVTSRGELSKLIEQKRNDGVFLTVLGFGSGNYKDDTMEMLADKGNGNYSYIDSLLEAKKVLVKERLSNLYTLAKDVKLQIEFNPAQVGAYRLIGYDNRVLADEDFNNDSKDAGEIGVGHTVTALYEIIPPGSPDIPNVTELKYKNIRPDTAQTKREILTVNLRYKEPADSTSQLLSHVLKADGQPQSNSSNDLRFASAVAWLGMYLQQSEHLNKPQLKEMIEIAKASKGQDVDGHRAEFIKLAETAELLENS